MEQVQSSGHMPHSLSVLESLCRAASQYGCSPCRDILLRTREAGEPGRLQGAGECGSPQSSGIKTSQCLQASAYCLPAVSEISTLCSFPAKNKVLFALGAKALGPS